MKIEQQYQILLELKPEIEERLKELNFQKVKELFLWLAGTKNYHKLKSKDEQLHMLDIFCAIWLDEKKCLPELGIDEDIFSGVGSLKEIENKYQTIKFGVLRLERAMPEEYYEQVVDRFMDYRVSGIAIARIIYLETLKREENVLKMAGMLKARGQIVTAMLLVERSLEYFPENKDFLLELADCWLAGRQWNQAVACLKKIEAPDAATLELIEELEKSILYENL